MSQAQMPEVVVKKVEELQLRLNGKTHWNELAPLQRFALVKLTRGGHENANFLPALREFGMAA
jgi:hypothetical protein